jgi:hypothetical protein
MEAIMNLTYPSGEEWKEIPDNVCFLLCSDGLIPEKGKDQSIPFNEIIYSAKDIKEAAEQLISTAFYNGSSDNITVVLVETGKIDRSPGRRKNLPFPPNEIKTVESTQPGRNLPKWSMTLLGILILILIFLVYLIQKKNLAPSGLGPRQSSNIQIYTDKINVSPINKENSKKTWHAFDKADYYLPLNSSSLLNWNRYRDSASVLNYLIIIRRDKLKIDSINLPSGVNSIRLSKIKKLVTTAKYKVNIEAILKDGSRIQGNEITFTYQ